MSAKVTDRKDSSSKDAYAAVEQGADKILDTVRQSVPRYHQSVTNVQQEYVEACENMLHSSIMMQREFAQKAGVAANVPDATLRMFNEIAEEAVKAISVQNQMALATIDATQQNIKTFNGNAKAFADLNRNILQSWISAFTAPRN